MPHDQKARVQAHKAGRLLASTGETRATVNDVARTLPVDEADALLAGFYAETRCMQAKIRANGWPSEATRQRRIESLRKETL